MIRLTVHFSGRVQGVGFRYTTQRIARHHAVAGVVENLDDGRVQLVIEGQPDDLRALVADISEHMRDYIGGTQIVESPATQEFGSPSPGALKIRR